MKNKNVLVLVAAAVALLVVAYLLSRLSAEVDATAADAGPKTAQKKREQVQYPRDKKPAGALATDRATPVEKPKNLDAMQRALLGPGNKGAVFVEANAIRHAPLMEKILRCREGDAADGLERMKSELGIDPMEDLDRIGFDGQVFVASGFFDNLKLPPEIGEGTAYGDGARLWTETTDDNEKIVFGKLGNGMLITGADEAQVKGAIDRAEGRAAASGAEQVPAGFGQGEIYGTVGKEFLTSLLGESQDPLAQNLANLLESSTVRMNVDEDAALSLDMKAVDEKSAKDLSAALKGALALARTNAESTGDEELAYLLEQARVEPREGGRFDVDVAVPGEMLLKGMGCGPDGTPLSPAAPRVKPAGPAPAAPAP